MTDLSSASNGASESPKDGPTQGTTTSSLAKLPPGMDAELRRLEHTFKLDMEDRRLKEKHMDMEDRRTTRGQWMAFTLALVFLGVLIGTAMVGAHVPAAILAGSGIAVGIGSFIYNNRHEPNAPPQQQNHKTPAPTPKAV